MLTWLKTKLGITALEAQVETTRLTVGRLDKKVSNRIDKKALRYDEVERARKRRKKQAT